MNIPQFSKPACIAKNGSRLMNKIASIWGKNMMGYLFLKAHSFLQFTLSENCSLHGTDNVRRQILEHIFAPNAGLEKTFIMTGPLEIK